MSHDRDSLVGLEGALSSAVGSISHEEEEGGGGGYWDSKKSESLLVLDFKRSRKE